MSACQPAPLKALPPDQNLSHIGIKVPIDASESRRPARRKTLLVGSRLYRRIRARKNHPPGLKAKVAVEAIKAHRTTAQIAQMFGVHPTQVGGWKKQALNGLPDVFGNGREHIRQQSDAEKDELYKQIGQLKVELDFLKKRAGLLN